MSQQSVLPMQEAPWLGERSRRSVCLCGTRASGGTLDYNARPAGPLAHLAADLSHEEEMKERRHGEGGQRRREDLSAASRLQPAGSERLGKTGV